MPLVETRPDKAKKSLRELVDTVHDRLALRPRAGNLAP